MFVLHRLIQVFTQSWLALQEKKEHFEKLALRLVSVKFPHYEYESRDLCEMLLPHAQKVSMGQYRSDTDLLHCATMLYKVARFEMKQGHSDIAYLSSKESLTERRKLLGKEHPATLRSMDNLAWVLCSQGKDEEAEVLL